jgi:replicative DNA helicase
MDYNVLQIFFEDNPGNIKRKHYTIWSEISPKDQPEFKEEVMVKVEEAQKRSKGSIRLLKLPSDNVTISEIKSKMRKMISDGFKIDLLIIDYVDCISPERATFGEEWKGEGTIMRSLESMTGEFDIAIWTATQGNRESISSEVVTGDQMGGSIKKAQIAHVILSIAKTLEQKEHNLATLTLLKSRIGRDGVVFTNCKFNNEFLFIDTETQNTLLGYEEQKVQERANRAQEVYRKAQEKKQLLK